MQLPITIAFAMCANFCLAQLWSCENVLITINPGVQITVKGDFQNNFGTIINNKGNIDLTGNWSNNSGSNLFGNSSGTVLMNGVNQTIGGVNPTLFNNLNFSSGYKTLTVDAETGGTFLMGQLNLNAGTLDLNSHTLKINNPTALGLTRTSGYIISEDVDNSSKVWWVNVGQGIHTIPFLNASGEEVFFSFSCSASPPDTLSSLRVSTYQTAPANTPYPLTPVAVTHVRNNAGIDNSNNTVDRFWHIEKACASANYYFNYGSSENAANGNVNMRAQQWSTATIGWDAPLPAQTNPVAQQVYLPSVVNQNPYLMEGATWAIAMQSNPLPVELLAFAATAKGNESVECLWSTASETNNDYFIVLRSKDGINFEPITKIAGEGNSNSLRNYSFIDKKPFPGVSYYKLQQVDYNGNFSFSQTERVTISANGFLTTVFPNPATGIFYVDINISAGEKVFYVARDLSGKRIIAGTYTNTTQPFALNLNTLAEGVYFFELICGTKKHVEKIQLIKN